jgi:hypothetical protein
MTSRWELPPLADSLIDAAAAITLAAGGPVVSGPVGALIVAGGAPVT